MTMSDPVTSSYLSITCRNHHVQQRTSVKLPNVTQCWPMLGLQSDSWLSPLLVKFAPFCRREMKLSIVNGLVIRAQHVISPQKWRQMVKNELHEGHSGSQHMKVSARSYVWWPNIDAELEATAAGCNVYAPHARDPPKIAEYL